MAPCTLRHLALLTALFASLPAHAQTTPTDLATAVNRVPWNNGLRQIKGGTVQGLFQQTLGVLYGMGAWDANGVFSPNIPNGSITAAKLAPGAGGGVQIGGSVSTNTVSGLPGTSGEVPLQTLLTPGTVAGTLAAGNDSRIVNACSTTAGSGCSIAGPFVVNRATLGNNTTSVFSGSSPTPANTLPLFSSSSITGSSSSSGSVAPVRIQLNSDTLNYTGAGVVSALEIIHVFGGTGEVGSRAGLEVTTTQNTADDAAATGFQNAHLGAAVNMNANVNDGGTSGSPRGVYEGLNVKPAINATNGFFSGYYGIELDQFVAVGNSVTDRFGMLFARGSTDGVQGALTDTEQAFSLASDSPSIGARNIFQLGTHGTKFPMDPNGAIITSRLQTDRPGGTTPTSAFKAAVTGYFADFRRMDFSTALVAMHGLTIAGDGSVNVGTSSLARTANGVSLDANAQAVSAASVSAGGGGAFVGDRLYCPNGVELQVTSVSGSAATGLSVLFPGSAASPPSNPVSCAGSSAFGVTANLTWALRNQMDLSPSGGLTTIGGLLKLKAFTVATLPTCGAASQDAEAVVNDAASPTYRGALTGGGTDRVPVYCDGNSWTAH